MIECIAVVMLCLWRSFTRPEPVALLHMAGEQAGTAKCGGLLSPCENLPQDAGTIFTSAFASAAEDATADFIVLLAADGGGDG